jgi:hypothetical protein
MAATADAARCYAPAHTQVNPVVRFDNAEIQQQIATLNNTVAATSGITVTPKR